VGFMSRVSEKLFFQGSKVTGTLVNTRDITERKRIEEAERAKAARAEIMAAGFQVSSLTRGWITSRRSEG